jgi:hypothetical protein
METAQFLTHWPPSVVAPLNPEFQLLDYSSNVIVEFICLFLYYSMIFVTTFMSLVQLTSLDADSLPPFFLFKIVKCLLVDILKQGHHTYSVTVKYICDGLFKYRQ